MTYQQRTIRFIVGVGILFFTNQKTKGQSNINYSKQTQEKIQQVENNLISWVKLDSSNWNIYERMKEMNVNGVSIAVISNYKIEWVKSYGWADTAEKRRVTNQTLFQCASIGKSLNGLAYMKLAQNNQIDLYADINNYLHTWKFPYDTISHGKKITTGELLSHTAGLNVHGFDGYKWNERIPAMIQILNGEKPANSEAVRSIFEPGLKFEYSGGGYEISELMLENISNQSYQSFIKKNIFQPLKMTHSTYALKPAGNICATAYRFDGQSIGCKYHVYPEKACGAGLWTTATDLAKFIIEIQLSLQNKSNKIINKRHAELMLTPFMTESNYGYGFFIDKKGSEYYFQHSGLNEGFSSQYYGSMNGGNGVVILVNSDNTEFKDEIANSVATVYGWKDFYWSVPKKIIQISDSILNKYVGRYKFEHEDAGPTIIKEKGALYLLAPGSSAKWKMYFTSSTEFFMLEARGAMQQFFFDDNGVVKGHYIIGGNSKEAVYKIE